MIDGKLEYTDVSLLMKCPAAYELRIVKGVRTPPSTQQFLGIIFHAAAAYILDAKLDSDAHGLPFLMSLDECKTYFSSLFTSWPEEPFWKGGTKETDLEMGLLMMEAFHSQLFRIDAVATEVELTHEVIVDGQPQVLYTRLDFIDREGVINDFKTAARLPTRDLLMHEMQPIWHCALNGGAGAKYRYLHVVKAEKPFIHLTEFKVRSEDVKWLLETAVPRWVRQIRTGVFPPRTDQCRNCDYKKFTYCRR